MSGRTGKSTGSPLRMSSELYEKFQGQRNLFLPFGLQDGTSVKTADFGAASSVASADTGSIKASTTAFEVLTKRDSRSDDALGWREIRAWGSAPVPGVDCSTSKRREQKEFNHAEDSGRSFYSGGSHLSKLRNLRKLRSRIWHS